MLQTLKNAWKIPELRKKLLFTLFILLIYRLGSVIPVPFIDVTTLANYFDSVLSSTILGLYNAMSGHPEANTDDADSNTVRLYQGFWSASDKDTFNELYGYTQDIYENAYSCADLMEVIKAYNTDTTPDDLKALTEAYTVEDVQKRIEEN